MDESLSLAMSENPTTAMPQLVRHVLPSDYTVTTIDAHMDKIDPSMTNVHVDASCKESDC